MTLIDLIVTLLVVGVILWLINNYIPTEPPWLKPLINALVALFVIIWLLGFLGVDLGGYRFGHGHR